MTTAARPYPANLRLLTALRAFAALMVVLFHFSARAGAGSVLHTTLIDRGQLGVDVFFVLSGFILAHVYLGRVAAGRFGFGDFLANRIARLYPVHLAMLAAAVINGIVARRHGMPLDIYGPMLGLDPVTGHGFAWNLATNLALVHAWGTTNGHYFNSVSWSISAEAFAYVLFPVIAGLALAFGNKAWLRIIAALMLFASCEAASRVFLGVGLNDLSWRYGILRILPEFSLGVAAYGLGSAHSVPKPVLAWLAPAVLAGAALMLVLGAPLVLMPPVFAAAILMLADCERNHLVPPDGFLKPLVYLGEISYSTYMLHLLIGKVYFNALAPLLHDDPHNLPAAQIVLGILPILAASALSFHFIEQPGRRLIKAFSARLSARDGRLNASV